MGREWWVAFGWDNVSYLGVFSPPIALPTFCYATAVFGYIHGCCGSLMTMCIVVARVDDDDNVAMIPQHNTVLIHELSEYSPMSGPAH